MLAYIALRKKNHIVMAIWTIKPQQEWTKEHKWIKSVGGTREGEERVIFSTFNTFHYVISENDTH